MLIFEEFLSTMTVDVLVLMTMILVVIVYTVQGSGPSPASAWGGGAEGASASDIFLVPDRISSILNNKIAVWKKNKKYVCRNAQSSFYTV